MPVIILQTTSHTVLRFAARELARYLGKATGAKVPIVRKPVDGAAVLRLEVLSSGDDDDRIVIAPEGAGYRLVGSNPRSVLFAVYRYLRALGFRWIRPGARGEIIPSLTDPAPPGLHLDETASYRYRTICIEGAPSQAHVVTLIDWLAKQGMNGYFAQFDLAHGEEFWARWYRHQDNPLLPEEPINLEKIERAVVDAIERRGLRFESMGHGWIDAVLADRTPQDRTAWFALLHGAREPGGHLCYSTPAVRAAMVDKIVAYARTHRNVSELHVWLADGCNNNCECDGCRDTRPADWYVLLLNELDAALTTAGLATRIVFLIYVDLLWPPVAQRLAHPERFVLMFAPITRNYRDSLMTAIRGEAMTPYARNQLRFPATPEENLAYLDAWQTHFHGEGFDFDYHLIWSPYRDLAQFTMAKVLHRDIQGLATLGLHGFNSCQNQRQSFPHNLGMDVMARTLWDKRTAFGRIVAESFRDAYGEEGPAVARFFQRMSELAMPFFELNYRDHVGGTWAEEGAATLPAMLAQVRRFRHVVRRHRRDASTAIRWSWRYLGIYLDIMERWIPAMEAYLRRDLACRERFEQVFDYLRRKERLVHPDLDVFAFIKVAQWCVGDLEAAIGAGADQGIML